MTHFVEEEMAQGLVDTFTDTLYSDLVAFAETLPTEVILEYLPKFAKAEVPLHPFYHVLDKRGVVD
jgi:hypothetical protein